MTAQVDNFLNPYILKAATALGLYIFFNMLRSFLSFISRHTIRPMLQGKKHTYDKYSNGKTGKDGTWAVVTGGSDGIGLAMCKKLCNEGFNICIIARNE